MPIDHPDLKSQERLMELYKLISNGDEDAFKFIIAWGHYVHNIDDQVDKDKGNMQSAEDICANYFNAFVLYNSNFWIKNRTMLLPLIPLITNDYLNSSDKALKSSDYLRSSGNNMLKMIAYITGDWPLLRQVSPMIDQLSSEQQTLVTI